MKIWFIITVVSESSRRERPEQFTHSHHLTYNFLIRYRGKDKQNTASTGREAETGQQFSDQDETNLVLSAVLKSITVKGAQRTEAQGGHKDIVNNNSK